jgi:three-Cys-motif partner protein
MSKTKEFFNQLQVHSEAKLKILDEYVISWIRKITLGKYGEKCLIIDGFSGSGKYDNNSDGSPIRLVKHAMNYVDQCKKRGWEDPEIMLLFIEGHNKTYDKLVENLYELTRLNLKDTDAFLPLPGFSSIQISCRQGSFAEVLSSILSEIKQGYKLIPSFCFIDPFGFKDTPFSLIERYIRNDKSEILFNFIFEETNRFINHKDPKIQEHMKRHFGIEDLNELQELIGDKKGSFRKEVVVDFYARQLTENTDVKHILTFEIKKAGRTKLILFYGTKNLKGLQVMKKAMWKIDGTGFYMFDDRKKLEDVRFQFTKDIEDDIMFRDLADLIFNQFSQDQIKIEEIEQFVLTQTIYPVEVYAKKALVVLESDGRIKEVKNRKRRNSYPPNSLIKFN